MIPARLEPVLTELAPLAAAFEAAGFRLYLVGGTLRDLFAGRPLADVDLDLTTDATPDQIAAVGGEWADSIWDVGARFGTIGLVHRGRTIEVTTHRSEVYVADTRKPSVTYTDDVVEDLSRRDFTVNAMALELTSPEPRFVDPFDGLRDLGANVLRTPIAPEQSFGEDPLRMMRAARFIAGYGLQPVPELTAAVRAGAERMEIVSPERIRDELNKLMVQTDPSAGLWFLHDTALASTFLPELMALRVEQDPIHRHKDVLTHTIAVVAKTSPNLVVRLAALFHDVGKPATKSLGAKGVSFHHHEVVGARMTRERMRALRYPKKTVAEVSDLVYLHLRFHTFAMGWTDAAVRRFVRDAGDQLPELLELTRCDCTTRNRRRAEQLASRIDRLETRIAEVQAADARAALRPDLDGQAVMTHLGIPPGPVVGQALAHLLELRLERGPLDHDEALAELDRWYAERS